LANVKLYGIVRWNFIGPQTGGFFNLCNELFWRFEKWKRWWKWNA